MRRWIVLLILGAFVSGCGVIVHTENEQSVTLTVNGFQTDLGFEYAQKHCQKFGKNSIHTSEYGNRHTFICR
jgi:hypothetical protein